MISEEERNIARYIAEVHNFANKGIKGRGVGRVVSRLLPCPSTAANFSGTSPADGTRLAPGDAMPLLARGLPASYASTEAVLSFFQTYEDRHGLGLAFGAWVYA